MENARRNRLALFLSSLTAVTLLALGPVTSHAEDTDHPQGTIRVSTPEWKYPQLAQVTFESAMKRAVEAVPGDVLEVGLDGEDGFLVYEVKLATPDHELMEVILDAGTGTVLAMELDDDE